MSFLHSLNISGSALTAHRLHMDVISQNVANADTTMTESGEAYRRQKVVFQEAKSFETTLDVARRVAQKGGAEAFERRRRLISYDGVQVSEIFEDDTPFIPVYDPTHPHADEMGYVYKPNVDVAKEELDLMAATRSYEANLTVLNALKQMASKALTIGQ